MTQLPVMAASSRALAPPVGLTEDAAAARMRQGLGNTLPTKTTRTYLQIARENVFTFFNVVLWGLGIALIVMGRASDAFVAAGVVLVNVAVSVIQEVRAKRMLDHIALLTRPHATVQRAGQPRAIAPEQVVQGDVLVAHPGDQCVADGPVVFGQGEMDESLLTGEADAVAKHPGDSVSAGTFCVSGTLYYHAERVGAQSTANQLAQGARRFRAELTPLQREVNLVIQILLLVSVFFELLVVGNALIAHLAPVETVQRSVVVLAIIPVGLFLAISVAYALGSIRIAGHGALIQQANAIDSLSHVDILCLDKTGTLTTNALTFDRLVPLAGDRETVQRQLAAFAATVTSPNKTTAAIALAFPDTPRQIVAETPFSSTRKWSAVAWDAGDDEGIYVLGAPEMLLPALSPASQARLAASLDPLVGQGLRVLLFAQAAAPLALDAAGQPQIPARLTPLSLVTLTDTLRPEARQTLASFAEVGVQVKVISGDHPETVAIVARQAGMAADARRISGTELATMDDAQFAQAAEEGVIFGRIAPHQKERLVQALRAQGHYVAMIGDGVNDVLSLKHANVGIAMQSGSQATRNAADIILLHDSFAPLPVAFREGQRIRSGIHQVVLLFMTRVVFVAIMILAVIAMTDSFAFTPKQNSLLAFITGGVPALALVAWAHPRRQDRPRLFVGILHFALPAVLIMSVVGMTIFIGFSTIGGNDLGRAAQTALTDYGILCGVVLMLYVVPFAPFWAVREQLDGDTRPTLLALGLAGFFLALLAIPALRRFFELAPLTLPGYGILIGSVLVWMLLTHLSWSHHLLERFFHLDVEQ